MSRKRRLRIQRGVSPPRSGICVGRSGKGPRYKSLSTFVPDYLSVHYPPAERDNRFYRTRRTLKDALEAAAQCLRWNGKRHPHQTRIKKTALRSFGQKIRRLNFRGISTFDELHEVIRISAGRGIGPLTVYDTAQRIGQKLRIEPDKIYLHCGVIDGARNLGISVRRRKYLTMDEIPRALRQLRPDQLEDFLCIYKDELRRFAVR